MSDEESGEDFTKELDNVPAGSDEEEEEEPAEEKPKKKAPAKKATAEKKEKAKAEPKAKPASKKKANFFSSTSLPIYIVQNLNLFLQADVQMADDENPEVSQDEGSSKKRKVSDRFVLLDRDVLLTMLVSYIACASEDWESSSQESKVDVQGQKE